MKKIITAFKDGAEIREIADALALLSVESACCSLDNVKECAKDVQTDTVFSPCFDKTTAEFCHEKGITYISWVINSPAPELFVPQILFPTNRIFTADRNLYRILSSSGIKNIFHETAGFTDNKDIKAIKKMFPCRQNISDARERILFSLEEDEKKYLLGLEKAQELVHCDDLFFRALSGSLTDKIYASLRLSSCPDPVSKRYYVCDCLLRQEVKSREKRKLGTCGKGHKTVCFDDTGIESLSAMLSGKTLFSDGCGISDLDLEKGTDYIPYCDVADLALKLNEDSDAACASKKIWNYSLKNALGRMIFS